MAWEYSEKTKKLFMDAVSGLPGTHIGEIENPDGFGEHGSIACGDALRFTFRVEKHPTDPLLDIITEARYLTFGCTSAIAASEALCDMIEGKKLTPIESLKITNQDIVDYLEGLPEQKIHCSVMGAEALEAAVLDWAKKRGVNTSSLGLDTHEAEQEEGRVVCKCFSLTEPYIKRKITELNLKTIPEITGAIKAGGACLSCHHTPGGLQDLLNEIWNTCQTQSTQSHAKPLLSLPVLSTVNVVDTTDIHTIDKKATATAETLSPFQFAKKVEKVIDELVRPVLKKDGGDVEVIDIKETTVYVELQGACANCHGAGQTLKFFVEKTLKERVDERIRVVQV